MTIFEFYIVNTIISIPIPEISNCATAFNVDYYLGMEKVVKSCSY